MPTIVIACGARKIDTRQPVPAADLYTGSLFRAAKAAAQARTQQAGEWLILSAKHGLIHPAAPISPYEATIRSQSDVQALAALIASQPDPGPIEAWCPARYRAALQQAGRTITAAPLAGVGIGHQLQWLTHTAHTN